VYDVFEFTTFSANRTVVVTVVVLDYLAQNARRCPPGTSDWFRMAPSGTGAHVGQVCAHDGSLLQRLEAFRVRSSWLARLRFGARNLGGCASGFAHRIFDPVYATLIATASRQNLKAGLASDRKSLYDNPVSCPQPWIGE